MELLRPILELLILIPGAVICILPIWDRLKIKKCLVLCVGLPILSALCVGMGALCYSLRISTNAALILLVFLSSATYCQISPLTVWRSASVVLSVCAAFSCTNGLAVVVDALLSTGETPLWFYFEAGLLRNGLCWLLAAVLWHPATHGAREILALESLTQNRYIFWLLPGAFLGLTLFISPRGYVLIRMGYMAQAYAITSLALLLLFLLFYFLFIFMARGIQANITLQQEKQLLQMQAGQYDTLQTSIAETRLARHDLRHHFTVLSALAKRGELEELQEYLREAKASVPDTELTLCENPAVDGVAGYYAAICRREQIAFRCHLALPRKLPVTDMEVCMALSNLLENAVEASLRDNIETPEIRTQAELHGLNMIVLCVENRCSAQAKEVGGVFQSSKRTGPGSGIESVRQIAGRQGGYCKFEQENGLFRASVVLRGSATI